MIKTRFCPHPAKVGEFSGFEAKDLLIETQKAVGGMDMVNQHKELIAGEKAISGAYASTRPAPSPIYPAQTRTL